MCSRVPAKPSEDNRVVFAVADVAGKSIPAAMLMATFQASLKTLSTAQVALPELVANMNKYACSNSQGGLALHHRFSRRVRCGRRSFSYINAGHNTPILRRATGLIERLDVGGLPLGIMAGSDVRIGERHPRTRRLADHLYRRTGRGGERASGGVRRSPAV